MIRDAYKFQERWQSWKESHFGKIQGIRKEDHKILIEFLKDMELGLNTPSGRKGKRDAGTLLNLAQHNLLFLQNFNKPLTRLTKQDLHFLEERITKGDIQRKRGGNFTQFGNYIKDFKVLWHWMQRTKRVNEDITIDITSKTTKPTWVYLTEEQIKTFFDNLSFDMRVIGWFMYDSSIRVTELNSLKIENFSNDFKVVSIPDEIAKTFGRTINLKLSSSLLKEYVKKHDLKPSDFLITKNLWTMNKYLKYNCGKLFGKDKISNPKCKGLYGNFTLYDIRHNSAIYWLNRYPTQKGLMYRCGWKGVDKIEYYTEFLGVRDEITDEDMITGTDKSRLYRLESELEQTKEEEKLTKAKLSKVEREMREFKDIFTQWQLGLPKEIRNKKVLARIPKSYSFDFSEDQ